MPTFANPNTTPARIRQAVRALPAVLAGKAPDPHGIAAGFRARVAFAFLGLVKEDFQDKSLGKPGSDGKPWAPLSKSYLAYQRPITGRKPPKGGGFGPSPKDGLLTKKQNEQWYSIYRQNLAWLAMSTPIGEAKGIAAAIAWKKIKEQGGKTKIDDPRFGGRKPADYQILVDRGILRNSLTAGELLDQGVAASYTPQENQVFDSRPGVMTVGTNVPYAKHHHEGKGDSERRLWPDPLPDSWTREISDIAASGLRLIGELVAQGAL